MIWPGPPGDDLREDRRVRGSVNGAPCRLGLSSARQGIRRIPKGAVSAFGDAFAALLSGPLAGNDVRAPEFVIHEDPRVVAYHAPFDYLNPAGDRGLVGVTLGPAQMLKSLTVVRSYIILDPPFGEARKLGAAVGGGCPGSRRS